MALKMISPDLIKSGQLINLAPNWLYYRQWFVFCSEQNLLFAPQVVRPVLLH